MTDHIYLAHHGIKGQRWGVRRFRNPDGSLTNAGKRRYGTDSVSKRQMKKDIKSAKRVYRKETGRWMTTGKNVAAVDKKVANSLKSNSRRSEVASERDRVYDYMEKTDKKYADEKERLSSYDEALNDKLIVGSTREEIAKARAKAQTELIRLSDNYNVANRRYDELTDEYEQIGRKTAESYLNEYKRAVISDLGYDDIDTGVKLMDQYGLTDYALRWDVSRRHGSGD